MTVKRIVQTCQLIVLLNLTHTYVLFAANLDDFKSIAKKFIPDKLADQLTAMAAQNSAKYRQQMKTKDETQSESTEYTDEEEKRVSNPVRELTTLKKRFAIKDQAHGIDFDELVDRVRQKLEEKYRNKPKHEPNKKDIESEEITEQNKQTVKSKIARVTKTTTDNKQYYDDEAVSNKPLEKDGEYYETEAKPENDGTFFKEDDLTKTNDSYEDYVTPNRDKIFDSDVEATTKALKEKRVSTLKSREESRAKDQKIKAIAAEPLEDQEYNNYQSEEVKAQTESIIDDPIKAGNTPKKLKGTMIPTRQYFKMSSPNYSAKSAIAEKYDFNEPLPEKDREPEDLKYFVNPPASVNRKVKLTGI